MKKTISLLIALLMIALIMAPASIMSSAATVEASSLKKVNYVCTKETIKHDDKTTGYVTYTYNSNGNLSKKFYSYTDSDGENFTSTDTYTYDKNGNLTKEYHIKDFGEFEKTTINRTFDSNGNVTKKIYTDKASYTPYDYTATANYDSKGNITKKSTDSYDYDGMYGWKTTTKYTYDSNGNLTQKAYSDVDEYSNSTTKKYTYTYDKNGNISVKNLTYKDTDGKTTTTVTKYTYDSKNNPTKIAYTITDSKGKTTHVGTTTFTYNNNGKLTKKNFSEKDSKGKVLQTESTSNTYDNKGNLTKKVYSNNDYWGTESGTTTNTYNSNGYLTKQVITTKDTSGDTKTETKINTYDKNGNISKQVTKNDYSTSTTTFSYTAVKGARYEDDDFIFTYTNSFTYAGKAITPAVEVEIKENGYHLSRGLDYRLIYSSNNAAGTGKVKVDFINDYDEKDDVVLPFTIKLKEPTGLKASPTAHHMKLSWTAVSGAKYYKVEQSTDGKKWVVVASAATKNSLELADLKPGTKYQYRVTALNSTKKVLSKVSTVLKTQTLCDAPTITLTSTKSKTATVSWKKLTGATKYIVCKSTDGKKWTKVATTTATSYNINKLTGGKKIYVKVQATNAYGLNSAYSSVKSVTVKK